MNTATSANDSIQPSAAVPRAPLIAIVDDDDSVRVALKSLIDSAGFHAETFADGKEFLSSGYVAETDCLIADVRMPGGMGGLELQDRLRALDSNIPMIFISAHDDGDAKAKALRAGAIAFLQKPFGADALFSAITAALDQG